MRIALRPSGGRGDYELAGSYNGVHVSALLEKQFHYQITPGLTISGKAKAYRLSGKPRIRPEQDVGEHPYVVLGSILLLPAPRRELIKTAKTPLEFLLYKEYVLSAIDVDLVENNTGDVVFAPTYIWAKNQEGLLKVDFAERMAVIVVLWSAAMQQDSMLARLIVDHQTAVIEANHKKIKLIAEKIQKEVGVKGDVLPFILREFQLPDYLSAAYTGIMNDVVGYDSEDSNELPQESSHKRIRKWRRQAERGPGARKFSMDVREAYDYRCFFSGERFPKLEVLDSAGVDAAHILPWSTHELNSVENGICLCKQCHWGLDNGLLRLDFDDQSNSYLLSIPKVVEDIATEENFELEHFQKNVGLLDKSRLPVNPKLWPSPKHIQEFNSKFSMED
jgi:HNH endonuclease